MKQIKDFKEYLRYMKTVVQYDGIEVGLLDAKECIYETFFTFANRVDLFDDMEIITEINRFHMDLQVRTYTSSDININFKFVLNLMQENI